MLADGLIDALALTEGETLADGLTEAEGEVLAEAESPPPAAFKTTACSVTLVEACVQPMLAAADRYDTAPDKEALLIEPLVGIVSLPTAVGAVVSLIVIPDTTISPETLEVVMEALARPAELTAAGRASNDVTPLNDRQNTCCRPPPGNELTTMSAVCAEMPVATKMHW